MTQARCSCGRFCKPCACGNVPTAQAEDSIFDYRATPARRARIDARVRELFGGKRDLVGEFIEAQVKGVA